MKTKKSTAQILDRRKVIKWTAPVIASVSLPVHAECTPPCGTTTTTTTLPPTLCICGDPVITVVVAPKCSGTSSIGEARLLLTASNDCPLEIKSLTLLADDIKNVLSAGVTLPLSVTSTSGMEFSWIGASGSAISCLPVGDLSLEIVYCCYEEPDQTVVIDLLPLFVASVV